MLSTLADQNPANIITRVSNITASPIHDFNFNLSEALAAMTTWPGQSKTSCNNPSCVDSLISGSLCASFKCPVLLPPPQKKKCQKMSKLILGSRYQQLHPASKGPKGPCPFVSLAFSIGFHRLAHDLTRSDHDAVAVEQASLPVYGTRFVSSWKFISSTVSQRICCPPPSSRSWSSTLAPLKASVPRCLFCRPHSHSPGM